MDPARSKGSRTLIDPRISAIPDVHGHAKGEHRPFAEERPIAYSARMLFLWFYHACRRGSPRFLMVADHVNYLTFEDPGAVNTVRRALKLAHAGDLHGAAETAGVDLPHASAVSDGLRRGMRFSIGAEVDNDPRARPDAQNIVDAMRPDGIIRTVHFVSIEHPEKGADWAWPFDNEEFAHLYDVVGTERLWELYVHKLIDDVEKLPGHIVGHFYSPASFGHWPAQKTLEQYEDRLLDACHARGLAVEINTRFLYRDNSDELKRKYMDANARLIRKAKARGVGIAIGSDAHSPKDQGNGFDVVLKLLDDAKINEIVFPVAGRLARVALRATREHLEAQANTRPTASPGSSITGFSRAELGLPEEAEVVGSRQARAARESGPKKRAGDSKRSESSAPAPKSTSRRTAESSTASGKAKAARTTAKPAAAKPAATKPAATKPVAAKPVAAKTVAAKTVAAKTVAAKTVAAKPVKKVAKATAKSARPAAKKATPPKASAKPAAKKTPAKKPAAHRVAKPKRLAPKPAASKKTVKKAVKKTTKAASKGSATKKKSAKRR